MKPAVVSKFTWQLIEVDNTLNWVLGLALILVPDFFNRLFFGHELLSHWIYIVLGLIFLWFAIWQVDNLIKPRSLAVPPLRLSAVLAWLPALILSWGLVSSLGGRLLLRAKIILWLADVYMFLLGGWYWWVARLLEEE